MSRTTTREIIRICGEIAEMDNRAKAEVATWLQAKLAAETAKAEEKKNEHHDHESR